MSDVIELLSHKLDELEGIVRGKDSELTDAVTAYEEAVIDAAYREYLNSLAPDDGERINDLLDVVRERHRALEAAEEEVRRFVAFIEEVKHNEARRGWVDEKLDYDPEGDSPADEPSFLGK